MSSTAAGANRSVKPRRRGLKVAIGAAAVLAAGWFVYTTVNIVAPSQGELDKRVDAVVSLAPQSHRLPMAQQLVADGVADTLAISYFDHDTPQIPLNGTGEPVPLEQHCEQEHVVCFRPADATAGEAEAVAEIVRSESWNSLTVVTNQHHTFRTRFIFDRCLGKQVDVNVVYSHRDYDLAGTVWRVVYENAAMFKAFYDVAFRC
ncbi:ElyC/SanA/YdcF family protein [Enteractinococcus fodinae]|uniref:Uncharacterized SAM-binding protein YcdF (DUF218 family) n=1 Tax=Enteractinococcus fodinae TaxID=684663 RepID=A0ABU2B304_9MICC|nr:ElyC/SanA/YdcF family protein [Enteractinococcus fodinae]MDR7347969.1 uncharacterized SAM-binding protein YcdF (DUF218 family) [Enteractinococcus fodinae]